MNEGKLLAEAAATFIGTPFKLQGRDPAIGLDCVGLVVAALRKIGKRPVSTTGYRLRNTSIDKWLINAEASSLRQVYSEIHVGDVLLVKPGPAQAHLLVTENANTFIHAHAGLKCVARLHGHLPWLIERQWRLQEKVRAIQWQR